MIRPLPVLLLLTAGCQTTVGHYLANRGRDLSECFLVQTGLCIGAGIDVKAAGLAHGSALLAGYDPDWTVGWVYGEPRPGGRDALLLGHMVLGEGDLGLLAFHRSCRTIHDEQAWHHCYALLPGLISWENDVWIWEDIDEAAEAKARMAYPDDFAHLRPGYASSHRTAHRGGRVHAFDIEVGLCALVVGARVGFSPGEFLDFLLGWFGIDLAGDDTPRPYLDVLEDETSSAGAWRDAARRAVARRDRLAVLSLLRGMGRADHARIALEAVVALGDVAVEGAITVYENPHADATLRASAGDALEALTRLGDLSPERKGAALQVLRRLPDHQ